MSVEASDESIPVVLDTNVLLSLYVFADSRFAPLRSRIENGTWQAFTNESCVAELARVLNYPMFKLSPSAQENVLAEYLHCARKVENTGLSKLPIGLPRCTDADDQKFLELARDTGAMWLITSDRALLKLSRRLKQSGMFMVITPEAALAET
jgi:putative PIN family toxin of toxin-antitoxin system